MATPAVVSGIYSNQLISTFDFQKPQELNKLFQRYGDQGQGFFMLIRSLGWERPVAGVIYGHWEDDWVVENFHVRNNVADPGAGNNALITLGTQDLDASNRFYPRLFNTVLFPNDVYGTIIDIDVSTPAAPVLTIRPHLAADNIGALTAGTELMIGSFNFSEGSGQPQGAVSGTIKYDNNTQIIKETLTATGTDMTTENWFTELSDPSNANIPAYYIKGQLDADYRMSGEIDTALMYSKRIDNNIVDTTNTAVTNAEIRATEGLVPFIRRLGNVLSYTPALFSIQKFDEIDKTLDSNFAGSNIGFFYGIDLGHEVENRLVDYLKDTMVNYVERSTSTFFEGNGDLAVSVGFRYLNKSDRIYHFKKLGIFSHPKMYASVGYNQPGLGLFLPMKIEKNKKPKATEQNIPTFGYRYKKLGKYSRMMEVWNVDGAGGSGNYVIPEDLHNHYLRCDVGAHYAAANQMILLDPA